MAWLECWGDDNVVNIKIQLQYHAFFQNALIGIGTFSAISFPLYHLVQYIYYLSGILNLFNPRELDEIETIFISVLHIRKLSLRKFN